VAATPVNVMCASLAEVGHRLRSQFATSPRIIPQGIMLGMSEGQVKYEWQDSPKSFISADSLSHLLLGAGACFSDPVIVPSPTEPSWHLPHEPLVPPPPLCPAPCLDAPTAPDAPASPPSGEHIEIGQLEPAVPDGDASVLDISRQPSGITCTVFGSIHHVSWQVDARKLEKEDKQLVSPQFVIALPIIGPQPFKIALYPKIINESKRGASFKKAKGKGKVMLKCEAQLPQNVPEIGFRIGIGRGDKQQVPRGPVSHNFAEQSFRGLEKVDEEWDFNAVVDESGTFVVSVALAPSIALLATSNFAWSGNPMLGLK